MPDLVLYEEDRTYVVDKFHNGHFDYIEVIQEVVQRDFFRYVAQPGLLQKLAETYPSPRVKPEVPLGSTWRPTWLCACTATTPSTASHGW